MIGVSSVVPTPDGTLSTDRFGVFGAVAANNVSAPDFLFLTTVVDFFPAGLILLPFGAPSGVGAGPGNGDDVDEDPSVEPDKSGEDAEDFDDAESAQATPGAVTTAVPMPSAIASPPTRPM